jgi:hypothetical protein
MTYRSLRLLALVALLAVPPFGAGQQVAAQTSPPRFILCAPAAAVAGIAQRHGLTVVRPVDQHAHDVFLVTGPTGVATPDLLSIVRSDTAVINFEPDTTRTLTETGFGLNQSTVAILDQSTVAILDALTDRTLSPFGDADVWNAYINQPASMKGSIRTTACWSRHWCRAMTSFATCPALRRSGWISTRN